MQLPLQLASRKHDEVQVARHCDCEPKNCPVLEHSHWIGQRTRRLVSRVSVAGVETMASVVDGAVAAGAGADPRLQPMTLANNVAAKKRDFILCSWCKVIG
jgi:hypothetical protein